MTQKAKICKALLNGEVLSILTGFRRFLVTNLPREISRQIEQPFGVEVSRVQKDFKTKDGMSGYYFEYRLNNTDQNKIGRLKMEEYVREITQSDYKSVVKRGAKTKHVKENEPTPQPETTVLKQIELFS